MAFALLLGSFLICCCSVTDFSIVEDEIGIYVLDSIQNKKKRKYEPICKKTDYIYDSSYFIVNFYPLDPSQILIFIILIALGAFFSGTEIAFLNVSKHTIQGLLRDKRWGAKSLEIIKSDMDKLLITVMIGNNLVNVGASALGTLASLSLAESLALPSQYAIAIAT